MDIQRIEATDDYLDCGESPSNWDHTPENETEATSSQGERGDNVHEEI